MAGTHGLWGQGRDSGSRSIRVLFMFGRHEQNAWESTESTRTQRAKEGAETAFSVVAGVRLNRPVTMHGGKRRSFMALHFPVIMAGLMFATLLTLLVVPVLYAILFRIREDEV